jgi:CRISPR-associated protein Cst2
MSSETKVRNNIFGTVLTDVGPSSNYRGDSEGGNFTPLQKLQYPDGIHSVFSGESIRNRLRDMLRDSDFPSNRSRLSNQGQLAVKFKTYPNPLEYADDKLFGFLALYKSSERKSIVKSLESAKKPKDKGKVDPEKIRQLELQLEEIDAYAGFQGDSVLRINYAVSISPFDDDSTMHQSPMMFVSSKEKAVQSSAIFHREVHVTAYQYPFGLNLNDLRAPEDLNLSDEQKTELETKYRKWTATLLRGISELNCVGGNHARTMFSHAPVSIVLRLTTRRTPDFDLYGFKDNQRELLEAFEDELPTKNGEKRHRLAGEEFYIGGKFAREHDKLKGLLKRSKDNKPTNNLEKLNLFSTPLEAIEAVIEDAGLSKER